MIYGNEHKIRENKWQEVTNSNLAELNDRK